MKTLTENNEKIISLSQLTNEDRLVYQVFLTTLILMARETKYILKLNPNLTLSEFPHLLMLNNLAKYNSIYYSVDKKAWILQKTPGVKELFNPKAISGILEFLSDFENEIIISSCELTRNYITTLLNYYGENS